MPFSKTAINIFLVAFAFVTLAVDHFVVSETENKVKASCDTRVAYDKSGSMYCMDIADKSVVTAQK